MRQKLPLLFITMLLIVLYCNFKFKPTLLNQFQFHGINCQTITYNLWHKEDIKRPFHLIVRLLSNDLPPLHGDYQTYLNTKLILDSEELPADFRRLWVLNCILNKTKEQNIVDLLKSRSEKFEILHPPDTKNASIVEETALNVNKARNFGVQRGFDLGADWVFILDGNAFLTQESLQSLSSNIRTSMGSFLYYLPMIRLQMKTSLSITRTYEDLFDFVSGQQECQLGVHRQFLLARNNITYYQNFTGLLFNEKRLYSDLNKLQLLIDALKKFPHGSIFCGDAFVGFSKQKSVSWEKDRKLMKRCGYVLRLLYHPEQSSPADQSQETEGRYSARPLSKENFKKAVELYLKESYSH